MYSIQYYKSKRIKPTLEIPNYSSDNRKLNAMKKIRYLHQKDLIDTLFYNIINKTERWKRGNIYENFRICFK